MTFLFLRLLILPLQLARVRSHPCFSIALTFSLVGRLSFEVFFREALGDYENWIAMSY
jgi:hypothetical protein